MYKRVITFFIIFTSIILCSSFAKTLPNGFVELKTLIPAIGLDIRYYTHDNFVGERIDGYESPKAILTI